MLSTSINKFVKRHLCYFLFYLYTLYLQPIYTFKNCVQVLTMHDIFRRLTIISQNKIFDLKVWCIRDENNWHSIGAALICSPVSMMTVISSTSGLIALVILEVPTRTSENPIHTLYKRVLGIKECFRGHFKN